MKKTVIAVSTIVLFILIAGVYKFNYLAYKQGYTVDGTTIAQKNKHRSDDLCDENANRYKDAEEAQQAGLLEAEYGATYCPEYKMHPSWDTNKDGINDCYESNSCSKEMDYMSPRF